VRAAKSQPDVWVMVLMDGVQTHVTAPMLEFFAVNNITRGLRPPNTSHLVQNEDLVTFWQFRNDKDSGYNKVKHAHLAKLMNLAVSRNSLDFRDAMERAWLRGRRVPVLAHAAAPHGAQRKARGAAVQRRPPSQKDLKKKASEQNKKAAAPPPKKRRKRLSIAH
jgi:hypothetical protein